VRYASIGDDLVKNRIVLLIVSLILIGCTEQSEDLSDNANGIVAEGIIYSLEYKVRDGKTVGFARGNSSISLLTDNKRWLVDAYGRLSNHYLFVTYPQKKDFGPLVIPAHQLIRIKFGDHGIKQVNENEPNPPK
jgi:hypothetical protein